MNFEVFFDVETQKLFSEVENENPSLLGVSIVSVYSREMDNDLFETNGSMQSFWVSDLSQLWPVLSKADRVIGFNSIKFDVPVLQPHAPYPLLKLPHFDILDEVKKIIGKRISLDSFAKETLDEEKSDVGINAVLYWKSQKQEDLRKLQKYCEKDVEITKQLYDYAIKNGCLKYKDRWNTPREIQLDFSYPSANIESHQTSMF